MSAIEHLPLSSLQPQGRFRLRRDSPLFEGLTLVALPNHGPRNLVSGYFGGYDGAPTLVAGPGGLELNSSMAGKNRLLLSPEFTTSSTPQSAIYDVSVLSALVITYQTAAQNVDYALGRMNGSGNPGWAVGLHSGSSNGPAARLGSYSVAGTTGGNRRSDPTVVLLTGDGTTATVYENGAVYASDSYTAPSYEYSSFGGRAVLMGGAGVSAASQCRTSLGLFWSGRVIPPAVAALIASPADVWRLLVEPDLIWVPVSAGGGISLVVADALHAHAADNVVLTSATAITIADALHAHAADNVVLTSQTAITIADALHAHAADNVVLQIAGATNLTVADALHAHTVDNVVLTSQIAIVVADALHAHTADGLTLTAASVLALQDALHAHAADNLTLELSGGITLTLADALHAHTADGVLLTVSAYLVVSDALHAHAADNILLSIPGAFRAGNPRVWILDSRQRYSMVDSRRRVVHLN